MVVFLDSIELSFVFLAIFLLEYGNKYTSISFGVCSMRNNHQSKVEILITLHIEYDHQNYNVDRKNMYIKGIME